MERHGNRGANSNQFGESESKRFSKREENQGARILGVNNLQIKSSPRKSKILLLETVLLKVGFNKGTNVL